jgi:hypothetical protein
MLYVNVTATLGVDVPPGASADDINAALEVASLNADDPIAMLAANPDRFFGRTTKARGARPPARWGLCRVMVGLGHHPGARRAAARSLGRRARPDAACGGAAARV